MSLFGPPDIEKLKTRQNVKGLAKALHYKKSAGIRLKAAIALQHVGDTRATRPLIDALNDEHKRVRMEAAIALGVIGEAGTGTNKTVPTQTVTALLDCDVPDNVRVDALVKIGPAAVDPLIQSIQDQHGSMGVAAEALGSIGDPKAVDPLINLLKDKSSWTKRKAAEALVKLQDLRAIAPLIEGLRNFEDRNYFRPALLTFGESAEDALIEALRIENKYIRAQAAETLGEMGCEKAAPSLVALLSETTTKYPAMDALKKIGPAAVDPLIEALKDETKETATIAYLLGTIGDRRAVLPLIEVSHLADEKVRFEAVQSLSWMGDVRAVPAMLAILQTENNGRIRTRASEFFTHTDRSVITTLIAMLQKSSTQEQIAASKALQAMSWVPEGEDEQQIYEALIHSLFSMLQNPSRQVRDTSRVTLQAMKWEPGTDEEQTVSWLAHSEVYRFEDIDLKDCFAILKAAISWEMDWSAKGRLAQILLDSAVPLDADEEAWAETTIEHFSKNLVPLLTEILEKPHQHSNIDEVKAKNLFLDYATMVTRASVYKKSQSGGVETYYSYNKKRGYEAVQALCQIESPVSSNLLHHISKLPDLKVARGVFEVEYDSEHPNGMGTSYMTLSFNEHRQAAVKELKRRGNPEYDPEVYRSSDHWRMKPGE